MKVRIKRINKSFDLPKYETAASAGFDFICREKTVFAPKEAKIIPSNNIIESPPGYFLAILPRSSTFRKKGLIMPHSLGVIDRDYSGEGDEIGLLFYNPGESAVTVEEGEKIAQGIFIKTDQAEWEETDNTNNKTRGGYGSTDKK